MDDPDRLNRALDRLCEDRSPRGELGHLEPTELRMLRLAQRLRGTIAAPPAQRFIDDLSSQLFPKRRRVSRRSLVTTSLGGLAAGLAAGLGLERLIGSGSAIVPISAALVPETGRWMVVARLSGVPHGSIHPFTAGAIDGFLVNDGAGLRALSGICTHMGCKLRIKRDEGVLSCPCHGAEFDYEGHFHNPEEYGQVLTPLPRLRVRVLGESVEVFGA
jgi:cytochrome b6-f complex iron-sulfur subunit